MSSDGTRRSGAPAPLTLLGRLALLAVPILPGLALAAQLDVTVTGVHPGAGSVRVALYGTADSFRHEEKAIAVLSAPAATETATVHFADVPAGRYAVIAYHDENDDKKLDLALGMFPEEGWGLSNDPSVLGPPSFDESAFAVPESGAAITVPLHY